MLDTFSPPQADLYEDRSSQSFDLAYFIGIAKRRIVRFAIPFLSALALGCGLVAIQRPIFQAGGEILLQSPGIAPDLVHPTVTELTDERFVVFKQQVLEPQNLLSLIEKYNLFPRERASMPALALLDLMRSRIGINPMEPLRASSPTIAFAVTFDYEVPSVALNVANELLTQILSEDASRRANDATEATKVIEEQVKKLQTQHAAVVAQIEAIKLRPPNQEQTISDERQAQITALTKLQADLAQKSSIYSDEYPAVKELKMQIAALKRLIDAAPPAPAVARVPDKSNVNLDLLDREESNLQMNLNDANAKLAAARLGEQLEKNQQAQRLRVVQYPELPYRPIKPKKLKWTAVALAIAGMMGAANVFAAEFLDRSIRRSSELATIIDKRLIANIPYLWLPGEERRRRWKLILSCAISVILTFIMLGVALLGYIPANSGWLDNPLVYALSGVLK